ncbi:MAG: translation initiation factor IF-2, partial [Bryobacteraceae bacterium]
MTKIRINELARQLEVPSHAIIDMLPELGVSEKKTHSSSIDEPVALIIRERLQGGGGDAARRESNSSVAVAEPEAVEERAWPEPAVAHVPVVPKPAAPIVEPPVATAQEATVTIVEEPLRSKPAPLRPPLSAGGVAPLHPPLRTGPIPARPVPAPRPGQILSGPRQPIPAATPPAPMPPPSITIPAAPVARTAPPPSTHAPAESGSPAMPIQAAMPTPGTPLRPQPRQSLAGQPAARPVVPPRADMVARLQQTRPAPGQVQPQAPRPGLPTRSSTVVPGQPIYRGPIRPGQPVMRGPGVGTGAPGTGGAPGGFRRPRTLHPTSPLRAEPATPIPTEQQRRHQGKPVSRDRHRDQEQEEGRLRMPMRREQSAAPPPIDREITISEGVTVKELSEKLGIKANLVIKKLVEKKIFATINQNLDVKMAEDLAREFGASTNKISYEEESTQEITEAEVTTDKVKRAPVVTIMGHVDHGKTSLLDAIRSAHVADREAGGITQHIGAYYVEKNGRKIVFIDTPGHEAFTRMRARGAKVTDIVILVVAADDGVMPQTLEAIDHAKAAGAPIIVAINKTDKPDAHPERVKQQLADRGLLAEDWGGDTVMVEVSAKTHKGLDLLLEMILLVTDMLDLKANPDRPAVGNVLEANLDRGRGPVATVLVRNGTLRVGDYFICGSVFGKVRAMFDDRGGPLREAEPSMPVEVLGLDSLPEVGDMFQVVTDTA